LQEGNVSPAFTVRDILVGVHCGVLLPTAVWRPNYRRDVGKWGCVT